MVNCNEMESGVLIGPALILNAIGIAVAFFPIFSF